jgi:ApaG protein
MYSKTTHDVTVSVQPAYLDSESAPDKGIFVWSYTVRIENKSTDILQLRTRHWTITDGLGRRQEVRGDGVVGEQPILRPGDSFEYTSGTPLNTPDGIMFGIYSMQAPDGRMVDIDIPAFSLDSPRSQRNLH